MESLESRTLLAGDIALLYSDYDDVYSRDVELKLVATGVFDSVTPIGVKYSTPTLGQLESFDAVLVWSQTKFADPVALGNVLADYADGGGGVAVAMWTHWLGYHLRGRWETEGYAPFKTEFATYRSGLRCLAFSGQSNSLFFKEQKGLSDGAPQGKVTAQGAAQLL